MCGTGGGFGPFVIQPTSRSSLENLWVRDDGFDDIVDVRYVSYGACWNVCTSIRVTASGALKLDPLPLHLNYTAWTYYTYCYRHIA